MHDFDPDIAAYYARGEEERRLREEEGRLRGWGRLEFVRTQEPLERFLPPSPAVVVDVGGGPGAYAAGLAGRGYDVRLLDPVELHVEQARGHGGLASVEVGCAPAGSWPPPRSRASPRRSTGCARATWPTRSSSASSTATSTRGGT